MTMVFEALAWLVAAVLLVPLAVLVAESLAALLPARRIAGGASRPSCAVLIPAHDEEGGIGRTVACLLPQLAPGDRLVVVADNCTDGTALAARQAGAEAIERTDPDRRGKGYALDFGVRHLEATAPDVVVIVDADCLVSEGGLDALVRQVAGNGRPAQAAYTLSENPGAGTKERLSAFAFLYKNVIRPRGLARFGAPCLLTGTGMAFPWQVLKSAKLASGNIVEDMQLGVDLALSGHAAHLCLAALVRSELPTGSAAALKQRTRWEHGHIQTLLTQVPRLLAAGLPRLRLDLLALALELSVPPLSMLLLLWAAGLGALLLAAWFGLSPWPAIVLGIGGLLVPIAIFAAWFRFGRERLPLLSLLSAPLYVLWKLPIYLKFLIRREKSWVRTERTASPAAEPPH